MRDVTAVIFSAFVFFACTKPDQPDGVADLKLLRVIYSYSDIADRFRYDFGYDSQDRLVNIRRTKNQDPPIDWSLIEYTGNEIRLTYLDPLQDYVREIRYILQPNDLPGQRYATMADSLDPPQHEFERAYGYDSAAYIYNAAGQLSRTEQSHWDSVYSINQDTNILVKRYAVTTGHEMTGGNLVVFRRETLLTEWRTKNGQAQVPETRRSVHTITFRYDKGWPGQNFGRYGFLFQDFLDIGLPMGMYTPQPNHPDGYTSTVQQMDDNGVLHTIYSRERTINITFTPEGRISRMSYLSPDGKNSFVDFEYGQ